ncbi:MAG: hypothetical protein NTY02_20375 [Acidobacteria bacterium]|nr:hypothetical protein [Acidobacteriota bacterium]
MAVFQFTLRGVEEMAKRTLTLSDFKKLVRQPLQDGLDIVAGAQRSRIKKATGSASRSIGTHIHAAKWGVYGNAGPRGSGRFREGFMAALFLNTGTGLGLRNQYSAGGAKFGQRAGGYSLEGGRHRRIHATRSAGLIYPEHARVLTFPAYGTTAGVGSRFGSLFGPKARSTTSRGSYKQSRYGALGKTFAAFSRGMNAQPWAADAAAASTKAAEDAILAGLRRNIAEAAHG